MNIANKRFKTDSQRAAVLVLIGFCVYGVMVKYRGSVAHHLSGRYTVFLKYIYTTVSYLLVSYIIAPILRESLLWSMSLVWGCWLFI